MHPGRWNGMSEPLLHWIDGESVAEYLETKTVVVSL